jgi:hypothetical protein
MVRISFTPTNPMIKPGKNSSMMTFSPISPKLITLAFLNASKDVAIPIINIKKI